ncbi:MAG: efflux RND transporter permease subunit [Marinilabiliales bacterium]|nr:MAG: efflux RND transporter permease subunit [Marinilabiliales bacterium]
MVKFLINRPVAVIMTFLALVLLGLVSGGLLPVSLLPDIQIPEITVQVSHPNTSARELENTVVSPLRQQLLQVGRLTDIGSETRDGNALVRLRFTHGSNMDYLYIEVNEKIDAIMGNLPADFERPRVIKASASDIPVFYLNLFIDSPVTGDDLNRFLELSEFADWVIRKRIEQLPEVAMVDVSGLVYPEVSVIPDQGVMRGLGLTHEDIRLAMEQNNVTLGSLMVRDGIYQYNVRFTSTLHTVEDVGNIMIMAGNRLFRLQELATVRLRPREPGGLFRYNDKPAVSMAVIKQSEARMNDMKEAMTDLTASFEEDYPQIRFELSRDQTGILNYTIRSLRNNLILGGSLAILIMFLFLKDVRSPFLIAMSVPTALIISLLFFNLTGLSLNIISLSGLILGVGMMIDNSIIVIDNITQHIERGHPLHEACIRGTNEVIRPLISSVLTTCAVFIPLIFLSGIAGALFYDQAIAVASGLFASLVVSVTLIPTLYHLVHLKTRRKNDKKHLRSLQVFRLENAYNRGFDLVFKYRRLAMGGFVLLLIIAGALYLLLPLQKMPPLRQTETVMVIDWNENIHLDENNTRVLFLTGSCNGLIVESGAYTGRQQFLLNRDMDLDISHAHVYLRSPDPESLSSLVERLQSLVAGNYPLARVSFEPPANVFDRIFESQQPPMVARITSIRGQRVPDVEKVTGITGRITARYTDAEIQPLPVGENLVLGIRPDRLLLYKVNQNFLYSQIRTALDQYEIGRLRAEQTLVPIVLGEEEKVIEEIIGTLQVRNSEGVNIPVSALVDTWKETGYSTITAGREGEYIPVVFNNPGSRPGGLVGGVEQIVRQDETLDVSFAGSWFETRILIREMMLVILISLLLLYFILAAQFESLLQPLIVMLEIPMNLAGVFLALYIAGAGINIMSMIGIVVMAGIVINDSILKIDTINHLRAAGMPLMEALHTGGTRRLKPIVMTSLTTILALTPVLISRDMGSELQEPLALAVIGGMAMGTLVSLYFIPLVYWYFYN